MNRSLIDFIRKHIFLEIASGIISILVIPSLLGVSLVTEAFIEVGWCGANGTPGQNTCLLGVYGRIIFTIIVIALFFQFILPIIIRRYKKWANKERNIDLQLIKEFKYPYNVLFVNIINSIFILDAKCSISTFPPLSELANLEEMEMKRIEECSMSLIMDKHFWVWDNKRINLFILDKTKRLFSIFGGERYSKNPLFSFGSYVFKIRFSGRNIFGKKLLYQAYLFVEYEEGIEHPKIEIKKLFEISKDERAIITKFEKRNTPSFLR